MGQFKTHDPTTMKAVFISNNGDDRKDGSTKVAAVKSLKRLNQLSNGNAEWHFVEGRATWDRLIGELNEK